MRIPVLIDRLYAVPPADVLQAVRRAAEWRESAVPDALRDEGLLSLEAWMDAPHFQLRFYEAREGLSPPTLRGEVVAHPQGARLRASCGRSRWVALLPGALAFLVVASWARGGRMDTGVMVLAIMLAAVAAAHYMWLGSGAERQARYLLDRFETALAPLPRVTPRSVDAGRDAPVR